MSVWIKDFLREFLLQYVTAGKKTSFNGTVGESRLNVTVASLNSKILRNIMKPMADIDTTMINSHPVLWNTDWPCI